MSKRTIQIEIDCEDEACGKCKHGIAEGDGVYRDGARPFLGVGLARLAMSRAVDSLHFILRYFKNTACA